MWKNTRNVNWIAFVSTCWGLLLTSVTFVSIVSASSSFGPNVDDSITFGLVCQLGIMSLGCIQIIFSAILFLSPSNGKSSWTTIWICTHVIVILGLVLFYSFHTYSMFWQGDLIDENTSSFSSPSVSTSVAETMSPQFTTLDAAILFDFLFLTIFFVSLLCENSNGDDEENLVDEDERPTRAHARTRHRRQMTMYSPYFIDQNNNNNNNNESIKQPPSSTSISMPTAGIDSGRPNNLPQMPNRTILTCNNHI